MLCSAALMFYVASTAWCFLLRPAAVMCFDVLCSCEYFLLRAAACIVDASFQRYELCICDMHVFVGASVSANAGLCLRLAGLFFMLRCAAVMITVAFADLMLTGACAAAMFTVASSAVIYVRLRSVSAFRHHVLPLFLLLFSGS